MKTPRESPESPPALFLIDGRPRHDAPPLDPSFFLGLHLFETLRSRQGRLLRPSWHCKRLQRGARFLQIPMPPRDLLLEELREHAVGDSVLRLRLGLSGQRVLERSALPSLPESVLLGPAEHPARPWLPDWLKHGSRASWEYQARALGVDELLLSRGGRLLETSRSNLFFVRDGVLLTPPTGEILEGVTRRILIQLARQLRLPLSIRDVRVEDRWEELYVSSALKGLVPAAVLGTSRPEWGPIGKRLRQALDALVEGD